VDARLRRHFHAARVKPDQESGRFAMPR
jgi:hypothetical protein